MTTNIYLETLVALWRWFIARLQELAEWYLACERARRERVSIAANVQRHHARATARFNIY